MEYVKTHIRTLVYVASIVFALGIYFAACRSEVGNLLTIRLEEGYGFAAAFYLLLALLPTPLYTVFPTTPGKALYTHARRAIGISTFCLAFLHAYISFFGLLQGFNGLPFLDTPYVVMLGVGTAALIILFLLAATSFDIAVRLLGPWWKRLHRFVYLAGVLTLIHVTYLGSHFYNPSAVIPTLFLGSTFGFLLLEAARVDKVYLTVPARYAPRFSGVFVLSVIILTMAFMIMTAETPGGHPGHAGNTQPTSTQ